MKEVYFQKIRGILILGVVFIHCMFKCNNAIDNCIGIIIRTFCNLAVPTFVFLSAYFFNFQKYEKDSKKYLINKIKRLIIPLFLWNIIYYGLNYKNISIIDFITFETSAQLYYIVVLIQLILLTPLLNKGLKNSKIKFLLYSVTPVTLLLYRILCIGFNYTSPLYKLFFSHWLIYYLIGLEAKNKKRINVSTKKNMLTLPIILIGGGGNML